MTAPISLLDATPIGVVPERDDGAIAAAGKDPGWWARRVIELSQALREVPVGPPALSSMADDHLVDAVGALADLRRVVDARTAALSGELHRRSQVVEPGDPGLARRSGHRTVENLVRATTGLGGAEATRLVRAGRAIAAASAASVAAGSDPTAASSDGAAVGAASAFASASEPWMHVAGHLLSLGAISVGAVDAIRRGVGRPASDRGADVSAEAVAEARAQASVESQGERAPAQGLTAEDLARLVRQLCAEALGADACRGDIGRTVGLEHPVDSIDETVRATHDGSSAPLHEDQVLVRARLLRDLADLDCVQQREQERREARSLTLHRRADGMTRLSWLLDPESAAVVTDIYDRATSPRNGGPRTRVHFVDAGSEGSPAETSDASVIDLAERIRRDDRTTAQLASDAFVQVLTAGAAVDEGTLLTAPTAAVRVLISAETLATRRGIATVEGQHDAVSLPTVDRLTCGGIVTPIVVDTTGQPLDVGRDQRLFTHRQRVALAARDGGCRWPGCERPPSWCEAHHIDEWMRDKGRTDTRRGILLCKQHHLLAHNHGWSITTAPPGESPRQASVRDPRDTYWLIPPREVDPERRPIRMPDRSVVHRLHTAEHCTA